MTGPWEKWGRNPKSPADFPAESAEERQSAELRRQGILRQEQSAGPTDPDVERELTQSVALAGEAPQEGPWTKYSSPSAEPTAGPWAKYASTPAAAPETTLFSKEGAAIVGTRARTALPLSVMQDKLRTYEAYKAAWEKDPKRAQRWGITEAEYNESLTQIPELQVSLAEIKADTGGEQSKPLQWAGGAVQSVIQNLPGLLSSLVSRGAGPVAALPALHGARETAASSTYAEAREEGAPVREANIAADVSGAAEVGFELTPLGFLLDKVGKIGFGKFVTGLLAREIPTELATTTANKVTDWALVNPDMTVKDFTAQLATELVDTAVVTAVATPLTGGIATAITKAGKGKKPEKPAALPQEGERGQFDPLALSSQATEQGAVFGDISAPSADLPTIPLEGTQIRDITEQLAATNPEDIDDKTYADSKARFLQAEKARKSPPIAGADMAWAQLSTMPTSAAEDAGELGASPRQAGNAANYVNPNTGDRFDRTFSFGPEGYVGLTPRQVLPKPGTYVLGQPSEDRPAEYLGPLQESVEQWRAQYLPDSTIVLSNEQLYTNSALGAHYAAGKNSHVIVPAVLRKPSRGLGEYNPNTQASAFYNATHEFGHALVSDRFYSGLPDAAVGQVRDASRLGVIPPELMAGLPPEQAAVVVEFNALKSRALNDQMTAQQFVDEWMGPAKIGRKTFLSTLKVSPNAPAKQLINALADHAVANMAQKEVKASTKQRIVEDILSLDEYLAEQTARHAFQKKWDEGSPLGKFFGDALRGLRNFFIDRKKDGTIAPGTAFSEWMEGLGRAPRPLEEGSRLVEAKKKQSRKVAPAKSTAKRAAKPKEKVETVQHNVETDTAVRQEKRARQMVGTLLRGKVIERSDAIYSELMGYASRNEFEEFLDTYTKLTGKLVKFEYDPKKTRKQLVNAEDVIRLTRLDPDLWVHVTRKKLASRIRKKGFDFSRMRSGIGGGWGRDWEPTGISVTRDEEVIRTYLSGENKNYDMEALMVRVRPKKVLDTTTQEVSLRELEEYGAYIPDEKEEFEGWMDFIEMKDPEQLWKDWLAGKDVVFEAWRSNELAMRQAIGRNMPRVMNVSGDELGPVIREELLSQGYDAILYPDEMRLLNPEDVKVTSVTDFEGWQEEKFSSPEFKAWFGDWERDPQGSSIVRIGAFRQTRTEISLDPESVGPPLVLFTTQSRLQAGENAFHASTPRSQMYAESRRPDTPAVMDLIPVVLNIRNPYVVAEVEAPAPNRGELEAQGYDGIVYQNDLDGDLSYIVFSPGQIKVVPDRSPYGQGGEYHLDLDHDQSTTIGHRISNLYRGLKNFVDEPGWLNRALKHARQGTRFAFQLQQLKQLNPENTALVSLDKSNSAYTTYKLTRMSPPDKILDFWEDMNNRDFEKIAAFRQAQDEDGKSWFDLVQTLKVRDGRPTPWWERRMSDVTISKLKERGIDPETPRGKELARHLLNIENSLLDSLNEDEQIIINLLAHRYGTNMGVLQDAVNTLKRDVHEMRQTPFSPRKWFGKYQVVVTKKSTTGPGYEVVHREAFDSAFARDRAFDRIHSKKAIDEEVQRKELTDTQYVLMGLPKDFLSVAASELGLASDQVDQLTEILTPVKQERLLKERDLKRLGITGSSKDVMRSYASYTWHHSNLQAKMLYRKEFNLAIDKQRRDVDDLSFTNHPDYYKQNGILRFMEGVRDYVMAPPNEWHSARAFMSIMYLAGNIATALVNTFGVAITFTDLTARHGSLNGEKRFMQAVTRTLTSPLKKLPPEIQQGLDKAIEQGVLDQTMAYHLAGQANSSRLWRVLSRRRAVRWAQRSIDGAMFPFRMIELFTRRVTFLAALQEQLEKPGTGFDEAYTFAVSKTNALQNDYTAGNRVPFMRGQKGWAGALVPMATIFMSFAQHGPGFHGLGGYELGQRRLAKLEGKEMSKLSLLHGQTMRLWALLFILGGYEGLPLAENLIDLAEWIWKRFGKRPIRQELREFVQSTQQDPELLARGLMHNVAGFDLSRKVGFGRLFPGTDVLAQSQKMNVKEMTGSFVFDMLGVTGHAMKFALEMTPASDKTFGEAMRTAPGAMGNLWNSYDWSKHGVRGPNGGEIVEDPPGSGELRDLTAKEIIGKAMGANPTAVSQNREIRYAQWDRQSYWLTLQSQLKKNVWRAEVQDDTDLGQAAREAIAEFNEKIADDPELAKLRISNGDIAQYLKRKRVAQRNEERGRPQSRKFRGLYEDIRRSYDAPEEDSQ